MTNSGIVAALIAAGVVLLGKGVDIWLTHRKARAEAAGEQRDARDDNTAYWQGQTMMLRSELAAAAAEIAAMRATLSALEVRLREADEAHWIEIAEKDRLISNLTAKVDGLERRIGSLEQRKET